ncbi:putative ribosomal protein L47 [Plasmopara halstedii]
MSLLQLRRLFGGLRVSAGQTTCRGLEDFFPAQKVSGEGAKTSSLTQVPVNVGAKKVVVGGEWKAWMLREKSTEDLHKLWYVLLKERNALLTELQQCRAKNMSMSNPSRRTKVKKSMARIKLVLHERSGIYRANQAKKEAS